MDNNQNLNFSSKKFILTALIITVIIAGGIFVWLQQYNVFPVKNKTQEVSGALNLNLATAKLAAVSKKAKVYKVIFSPDGKKVAYRIKKGKKWVMAVNGKEGKKYDQLKGFIFSPDNQNFAYAARKGKKWLMVVNGKEGKSYDQVKRFFFGSDSQSLAYKAEKGGKWLMVVNGKEGKSYDTIYNPTFTPDGKYITYGAKLGNEFWWIVDKVE